MIKDELQAGISVLLVADSTPVRLRPALSAAVASGAVRDVIPLVAPFERLAPALADALGRCVTRFAYPLTEDASPTDDSWRAIEAACASHPEAVAFRLAMGGLPRDPAWRGRRARGHERNLESLRFANLMPLGGVVLRRDATLQELRRLDPAAGADAWRRLMAALTAAGEIVTVPGAVRRRRLLATEPRAREFTPPGSSDRPAPSVLVFGPLEVSTSFYFDFLQGAPPGTVRFRAPTRLAVDAPHLAAADLVILVRELHRFHDEGVIALLERLGVPFVYFTDDNFQILRDEGRADRFYYPVRVAAAVASAAEVWASTPALAEALRPLHRRVRTWGPVLDPRLVAPPRPRKWPLTVGFAGGSFRLSGLHGAPIERLRALARKHELRVILTEEAARRFAPELLGAHVVVSPIEKSFRQFIHRWRALGVDILLHPAGATANMPYKCPTATITAGYLGAIPLVDDEPAYSGWDEEDGLLRLGNDGLGLDKTVAAALEPDRQRRLRELLSASLARRFGAGDRLAILSQLAHSGQPPRVNRAVLTSPSFHARTALRLARSARWLVDVAGRQPSEPADR